MSKGSICFKFPKTKCLSKPPSYSYGKTYLSISLLALSILTKNTGIAVSNIIPKTNKHSNNVNQSKSPYLSYLIPFYNFFDKKLSYLKWITKKFVRVFGNLIIIHIHKMYCIYTNKQGTQTHPTPMTRSI